MPLSSSDGSASPSSLTAASACPRALAMQDDRVDGVAAVATESLAHVPQL
jgi:hypothetical protein